MKKGAAGLVQHVDPRYGFALLKPPKTPFKFESAAGPHKLETPVLTATNVEHGLELEVFLFPPCDSAAQQSTTAAMARELTDTNPDGRSRPVMPVPRPDVWASFSAGYATRQRQGLVVSVAGRAHTYVLVSSFPLRDNSASVQDLMFLQLSLIVR